MNRFNYGALLFVALVAAGCGKSDSPKSGGSNSASSAASDSSPAKAQGVATGKVTFPDGKPIDTAGADISIAVFGISTAGEKVSYSPAIKADGSYSQKLVPGSYRFSSGASVTLMFDGQKCYLPLEPQGTMWNRDRDAADGIAQDFVWHITGHRPDQGADLNNFTYWYGVSITPMYDSYRGDTRASTPKISDGAKITFTLHPTGPRIDGKPGDTLTVERDYRGGILAGMDNLNDLPAAVYDLSGVIHFPDGSSKPLRFSNAGGPYEPSEKMRFSPANGGGFYPMQAHFVFD